METAHLRASRFGAATFAGKQIAATALMYGLTVVTRNVRHYGPAGVAVLNPFT